MTGKEKIRRSNKIHRICNIISCALVLGAILVLFFCAAALESGAVSIPESGFSIMIALGLCGLSIPFGW